MTKEFKQEVLTAFQKVSPSKDGIESKECFAKYQQNLLAKTFDLNQVSGKLFRSYNGLGTSYVVFHKPS